MGFKGRGRVAQAPIIARAPGAASIYPVIRAEDPRG